MAHLFPLLYAACFLALLWQAFRVMGQGFRAVPRVGDPSSPSGEGPGSREGSGTSGDRTGRVTIHPELLDADGRITREDLLTVRFSGEDEDKASQDAS